MGEDRERRAKQRQLQQRADDGKGASEPGKRTLAELEAARGTVSSSGVPGKRTLTELLALSETEAVAHALANRDGGLPIDPAIAAAVGAHTGVNLGDVRVHKNPEVQAATLAINARAFAHGDDIFLGPGESETDVALIAHELTHVAQQRGLPPTPQRKVAVGGASSPHEAHADEVAAQVATGAAPTMLLVDAGPVVAGQMVLAAFLRDLKALVTAAASEELGRLGSAAACPYIELYFARYGALPAQASLSLIKKWAPAAANAKTADAMVPMILERVRAGVRTWKETGHLPAELAAADPAAAAKATASAPQVQKKSLEALELDLGPGEPVDARLAAPLGAEGARIHRGPVAHQKAAEANAVAFAAGQNVVLGARAPAEGTVMGDALLAHELAHVAQQKDAAADPAERRKEIGPEDRNAETDADRAAERLATLGNFAGRVGDVMRTGVQLQRCGGVDPAYQPKEKVVGPDVGKLVGASAPDAAAKGGWYNEHPLTASEGLGVADDEEQATALAKTMGRSAAIIPSSGKFYVYGISGEADVLAGTPLDLHPGYVERAGLRIEAGVSAIISARGAVYRARDLGNATTTTFPQTGANKDPWSAYRELNKSKGGLENLSEEELIATFQAAMFDTALSVLATSEVEAQNKAKQFGTAGATAGGEHKTIDDTARTMLATRRQLDKLEEEDRQLRHISTLEAHNYPQGTRNPARSAAIAAEKTQLDAKQRKTVTQYPMLGRYKSSDELQVFVDQPPERREKSLQGDANKVASDVRETRENIQNGSLNLWECQPIVDATMAGLGMEKDSPQRARVKAKASAQKTKETVLSIALGVFSLGFGIAGAVFTGGASLAFTAGALGLGAYDAIKTTEEHFVHNAAANTDVDPDAGVLPAEAKQHWGWLVVAWAGVALDIADVAKAAKIAGEVEKVARGAQDITQAAEVLAAKLAKGDKKFLERLRAAAGDVSVTETITEAMRPGLSSRVGAEITIDGTLNGEVKVFYKVDKSGRSFVTGIKAGKSAKVGDILAHAETVKMIERYSGLTGRARQAWDRIRTFAGMSSAGTNPFEAGSKAFNSWGELQKLDGLIRYRRGVLDELLEKAPAATDAQAALRKEIAFLENEVDIHTRVVDALVKERGSDFIAMSNGTKDALEAGKRLPDFPDKAVLSADELKKSAYYYEREGDKFVLKEKVGAKGGLPEPKAAVTAPTPAKVDELKKSLGGVLPQADQLSGPTLVALEHVDHKLLQQLKAASPKELERLGEMLLEDATLGPRLATAKNPLGALKKATTLEELDKALLFNRLGELKVNATRVGPALQRSGVSAADLAKLSDADIVALGQGDRLLAEARKGFRPSEADPAKLDEAMAVFDRITSAGKAARDDMRAAISHAHGISDIPFMKDPGKALAAKFPDIPKSSMDELAKRHPDALRALETASQDEVQKIISQLGKAATPREAKDIEDILRSYMYKAQKKARRGVEKGGTDGLEVPKDVGAKLDESLETLGQARKQGHPFGFKDRGQYEQFMATVDSELAARGIKGKAKVQGSAMHSKTPNDIDMEIVVDAEEFDRLAMNFRKYAPSQSERAALEVSISKRKIPSYEFYPSAKPSIANKAKVFTQGADGKQLEVQATLIVSGSDFDLGPFL